MVWYAPTLSKIFIHSFILFIIISLVRLSVCYQNPSASHNHAYLPGPEISYIVLLILTHKDEVWAGGAGGSYRSESSLESYAFSPTTRHTECVVYCVPGLI